MINEHLSRGRVLAAAFAIIFLTACQREATEEVVHAQDRVARGEYLVNVVTCHDCHTPFVMGPQGPEPDMSRMLSGHPSDVPFEPELPSDGSWIGAPTNTAYAGPWGVSYAANLTPDENTGLGIWTEDMFIKALRTGRHMGTSRPIQPPMPWPAFAKMTDEDLKSIYAYLRTIPPVQNRVAETLTAEEYQQMRLAMAQGKAPRGKS